MSNRLKLMRPAAENAWSCNKKVVYNIYKSLIRSLLDYGCIVFDSACNSIKENLNVIQAKTVRICCGANNGATLRRGVHTVTFRSTNSLKGN